MKRHGFTLVEMLFVISIVMVLMLLVIPTVTKKTDGIKEKGCEALIDVINAQIQLFEINEGYLPSSVDDLVRGGYIEDRQSRCPNGKSIGISSGEAYCES